MMGKSEPLYVSRGYGLPGRSFALQGYDLAMYVFLPDPGSSPTELMENMNGDNWRRITMPGFSAREGWLVLPKFKVETTTELVSGPKKDGNEIGLQ